MNSYCKIRQIHKKRIIVLSLFILIFAVPFMLSAAEQTITVQWSMPTASTVDVYDYMLIYSINSDMQNAEQLICEQFQQIEIQGDLTIFSMSCDRSSIVSAQTAYFSIEALDANGASYVSSVSSFNITPSVVLDFRLVSDISTTPSPEVSMEIFDDFTVDLSKWTALDGSGFSLDAINSELDLPTTQKGVIIYTSGQTESATQWVAVEMNSVQSNSYDGVYFRSTNNINEPAYAVRGESNKDKIAWRYCYGATCTTIATNSAIDLTDNDSLGVEVEGSGSNTIVRVWVWRDQNIPVRGSWGAPAVTFTNNPPVSADTGTYLGLYSGHDTTSGADEFQGGSF